MNFSTRRAYWGHVMNKALPLCLNRGLPLLIAILATVLIAAYQQYYHVTIEHSGWLAFLKPYTEEIAAWFVFWITESCWKVHLETVASGEAEIAALFKRRLNQLFDEAAFLQTGLTTDDLAREVTNVDYRAWSTYHELKSWRSHLDALLRKLP